MTTLAADSGVPRQQPDIALLPPQVEEAVTRWCAQADLPEAGLAVIQAIRASEPSRLVRSSVANTSGRHPSLKMGVMVQFESGKVEDPAVRLMDHDADVVAFWDQPEPIKLVYTTAAGRTVGPLHTPDFFVIRRASAGWEEWKQESRLLKLAKDQPERYVRDPDGTWRSPPGEAYAAALGLTYRLRSSAEHDWKFIRNLQYLQDYLDPDYPAIADASVQAVLDAVRTNPGILLDDLYDSLGEAADADDVNALIARQALHVDLRVASLAEPWRVPVFADQLALRLHEATTTTPSDAFHAPPFVHRVRGARIRWDGTRARILNIGDEYTTVGNEEDGSDAVDIRNAVFETLVQQNKITGDNVEPESGITPEGRALLNEASPDALDSALAKYTVIEPRLKGLPVGPTSATARTVRRWLSDYRLAEEVYGNGLIGLLPKSTSERGNRALKLPAKTWEVMLKFVEEKYEKLGALSRKIVFGMVVNECQKAGVVAPSRKTWIRCVNNRPRYQQERRRRGRKAAYKEKAFYWELNLTTPRHGDRPWEIAHIDHTLVDAELLSSRNGRKRKVLGRAWLTILMDAHSRRILALYLTFDKPSYRSCMMVLRECVRRWGRLPDTIVVDGGAEFHSCYFDLLCALFHITKKKRAASQPRYGSVLERIFGVSNTQLLHQIQGNTKMTHEDVRQVTPEVNPKAHAQWTIETLWVLLWRWAEEVWGTTEHPRLEETPIEAFKAGVRRAGVRRNRLISFNEQFLVDTLPSKERRRAKVQVNGVKVNYIYYYCAEFELAGVRGTSVPVRFDPFDGSVVWAFVKTNSGKKRWVRCTSEHSYALKGCTERELQIAAEELKRKAKLHGDQYAMSAAKLAAFLVSAEGELLLREQRELDAEGRGIRAAINSGVHPDAQPRPLALEAGCDAPVEASAEDPESREPAATPPLVGILSRHKVQRVPRRRPGHSAQPKRLRPNGRF